MLSFPEGEGTFLEFIMVCYGMNSSRTLLMRNIIPSLAIDVALVP